MIQPLPYGGFEWMESKSMLQLYQVILQVDLEYLHHLHDLHNDIPFCPEHINLQTSKPSEIINESTKLMATLNSKIKYVTIEHLSKQ